MLYNPALEKMAITLRETLEVDSKVLLNSNNLEELLNKIKTNLPNFTVVITEKDSYLLLENDNFTSHISGDRENQFYDLVEQLTFSIMLDKKSMSYNELQHSVFLFPRMATENKYTQYLMLAFMMPKEAFYSAVTQYSSADGSRIHMFEMQKKVNKYCHKRGRDLQLW